MFASAIELNIIGFKIDGSNLAKYPAPLLTIHLFNGIIYFMNNFEREPDEDEEFDKSELSEEEKYHIERMLKALDSGQILSLHLDNYTDTTHILVKELRDLGFDVIIPSDN